MLAKRIIPCLDVTGGRVVKGVNFVELRDAGDPVEIAAGNLTGMKGRIVKVEGKRKMQVELTHLGYSLLITVDRAFLEKTGTE